MKSFKHSGTFGDLIYSLPVVKFLEGGKFYLHLNQIDYLTQLNYGSQPDPYHRGRMTEQDYLSLRDLMLAQDYVESFDILDPNTAEITHNLDRFRVPFRSHPGNYVDIYSGLFPSIPLDHYSELRNQPWLTVPNPRVIDGRTVVINRTGRWPSNVARQSYDLIREQGAEKDSVFIGHESEYLAFKQEMGWDIPFHRTANLLEMAEVIAAADQFIGNQSVALSLAIGLGVEFACELRTDLPIERNECFFPNHPNGDYF
ncbi:MAG: hypothetical protein EBU90_07145 [Proteobacteria bacterium]|nr:hypothetical protein [Pseudomonadota bacterium]